MASRLTRQQGTLGKKRRMPTQLLCSQTSHPGRFGCRGLCNNRNSWGSLWWHRHWFPERAATGVRDGFPMTRVAYRTLHSPWVKLAAVFSLLEWFTPHTRAQRSTIHKCGGCAYNVSANVPSAVLRKNNNKKKPKTYFVSSVALQPSHPH